MKTKKWKCLSANERAKVSMCFRRQKKCVKYMFCFVATFSSCPPACDSDSGKYADWLRNLNKQACAAERKSLGYWKLKHDKDVEKLTFSMINSDALDDLNDRFAKRPPEQMTEFDREVFA